MSVRKHINSILTNNFMIILLNILNKQSVLVEGLVILIEGLVIASFVERLVIVEVSTFIEGLVISSVLFIEGLVSSLMSLVSSLMGFALVKVWLSTMLVFVKRLIVVVSTVLGFVLVLLWLVLMLRLSLLGFHFLRCSSRFFFLIIFIIIKIIVNF